MLIDYVIQLNFYNYLYSLKDYINLISINKLSYKNYNYDTIYKYYLERKFSKLFTLFNLSLAFCNFSLLLELITTIQLFFK